MDDRGRRRPGRSPLSRCPQIAVRPPPQAVSRTTPFTPALGAPDRLTHYAPDVDDEPLPQWAERLSAGSAWRTSTCRGGDLNAAVSVGHDLLSMTPALSSVRVVRQLDALRRLLEPHRGYPPVREYLVRFDDARRAGMLLLADLIPPSPGGTTP